MSVQQRLSLGSVDREGLFSIVDVEKDQGGISCLSDLAAAPLPSAAPPPVLLRALADLSRVHSVSLLGTQQRGTGAPASVAQDGVLPAGTQPCPASAVLREPFSPVPGTSASGGCVCSVLLQAVRFRASLLCYISFLMSSPKVMAWGEFGWVYCAGGSSAPPSHLHLGAEARRNHVNSDFSFMKSSLSSVVSALGVLPNVSTPRLKSCLSRKIF